jgi:hypothetical protein
MTGLPFILWVVYILGNVALGRWHGYLRTRAVAKGQTIAIRHGWWGLLYAGLCAIPVVWSHSWYEYGSLILLHLSIFPVTYNLASGISMFNLSKTSTAITDRLMVWTGLKDTEVVNISAMVASGILLIIHYTI